MKIGIIGSGNIGASAARLFADAGHEVAISNSRGPESLASLVEEIGANAHAATVEDAASFGEVVLVAIPFWRYESLPSGPLSGKIVVDAMNYYPGRDGRIDFGNLTSSELLARRLPDARVVKAFNTMYYETLRTEGDRSGGDRLVLFIAGDDEEAKAVVSRLIEEIGFEPVDTGFLGDGGRKQQPGSPIYNNPMTAEQARETLAGLR
jgi:8-hydroxy-5-deazaflavin:NADPH oxidoreductase